MQINYSRLELLPEELRVCNVLSESLLRRKAGLLNWRPPHWPLRRLLLRRRAPFDESIHLS